MAKRFQSRDGALRFYDGTGTPYFVEMIFENGDIDHPLGMPEPEQIAVQNRGRADQYGHYIEGPDRWLEFLPFSFSFQLANSDPAYQKFRDIMNLDLPATWLVGGNTWVTTKGTTQKLSGGPTRALVTTPGFASGRFRTCNVFYLLTDPDGGALHIGYRLNEVLFLPDEQRLREGEDMVTIQGSGRVYGTIVEITSFAAGTES